MSTLSQSIPVERLWELYDYNPLTGQLWSKRYSKPMQGSKKKGALENCVCPGTTELHTQTMEELFMRWCTGTWPKNDVDHINRKWTDNRIQNLRDVDRRTNIQNKENFTGAHFSSKKWRAKIMVDKKQVHLGTFSSKISKHNSVIPICPNRA